MNTQYQNFGEFLQRKRTEKQITLRKMAEMIGITAPYLTDIEKDRRRAENDYKVNLKTEILIEDLYDKVNAILAKQLEMERQLQAESKKYEEKPQ